jgi:hypothetical protein
MLRPGGSFARFIFVRKLCGMVSLTLTYRTTFVGAQDSVSFLGGHTLNQEARLSVVNVMFRVPQHDRSGEYPVLRPRGYRFEFVEWVGV